jgi:pimeloyl-ACP methyl ester carboxylesterase
MKRGTATALVACLLPFVASTGASAGAIEDHYGMWLGKISAPNLPTLSTGVELFARADGSLGANWASPQQGIFGFPADHVSVTGNLVEFRLAGFGITFKLRADPDALVGEFRQGNLMVPVEFKRVSSFDEPLRPQTPKEPFPYQVDELVVTAKDGTLLAGTLTRPRSSRAVVAVVLLPGAGPADRDESMMGHHPFAVLADYLTRQGIAVYRFDKPGVGRSTGAFAAETNSTQAEDALAAVNAVRGQPGISRVGVIGHSEGGLIAAKLAAEHPKAVDFVISLAGPGLGGLDLMIVQDRVQFERGGLPPDQARMLEEYGKRFYTIIISNEDVEARMSALQKMFSSYSDADRQVIQQHSTGSLSFVNARSPDLRDVLMSNVAQYWRAVRCPTLALNGTLDTQVPAQEDLQGIRAGLAAAGNRASQIEALPNLNHFFQTAITGLGTEYPTISETIAPVALQRIAKFVQSQR